MKIHDRARKLAASGASNQEIFGAIEISAASLQKLMMSDPKFIYSIIQGRSDFIAPLVDGLYSMALGTYDGPPLHKASIELLLARADAANRSLLIAHEMILLTGVSAIDDTKKRDAETLTALLRSSNA